VEPIITIDIDMKKKFCQFVQTNKKNEYMFVLPFKLLVEIDNNIKNQILIEITCLLEPELHFHPLQLSKMKVKINLLDQSTIFTWFIQAQKFIPVNNLFNFVNIAYRSLEIEE